MLAVYTVRIKVGYARHNSDLAVGSMSNKLADFTFVVPCIINDNIE
jgi:hypothetical protein